MILQRLLRLGACFASIWGGHAFADDQIDAMIFPPNGGWSPVRQTALREALHLLEDVGGSWKTYIPQIIGLIQNEQIKVSSQYIFQNDHNGNAMALTVHSWTQPTKIWLHGALFQTREVLPDRFFTVREQYREISKLMSVIIHELYHFKNPASILCMTQWCIENPGYEIERRILSTFFRNMAKSEQENKINKAKAIYYTGIERENEGFAIGVLEGERYFGQVSLNQRR